jgi:hypothetical protein
MTSFNHKVEKISVIQVDDIYLAYLFGMCDGEELYLEDDMNDYIEEEIADGNIEGEETIQEIRELQAIIRAELETSIKVKVEFKELK